VDYANALISSVLTTGDMGTVVQRGINTTFFPEERDQRVFGLMVKHFQQYGTAPTPDVVLQSYPTYEVGDYPHGLTYYIDALAERRRQSLVVDACKQVVDRLDEEGEDSGLDAVRIMNEAVMRATFETSTASYVRFTDYMRRRVPEWMSGVDRPAIPYGIPTLDAMTGGIRQEQFIVLTGLAKARKSWTVMHMASNVHAYGFPVVFITFEMSNDEQLERLVTLWAKIPFNIVRDKTQLTAAHYKQVQKFLHVREQFPTFLGVEDAHGHSTVTSLQALIQETKPAVVFIDGVYFMTDVVTGQQGSSDTQALTNISRGLKTLAKRQKVAIVCTTQTLAGKISRGRTSLYGMGYTSAFSQDADVIIGVEALEDRPTLAVMRILGNRSGPQGAEFNLTWNLDTGLVEEVEVTDQGGTYDDVD